MLIRVSLSALLLLAPGMLSLGFDRFPATGNVIDKAGATVVMYYTLRTSTAIILMASCLAAGMLLRRALLHEKLENPFGASQLICSFALGAAVLALVLLCAGFAGLLYRQTALLI